MRTDDTCSSPLFLIDWLEQVKVIGAEVAARFRPSKDQRALDGVAGRAREFRDWLRGFVTRHMGQPLTTGAAKALGPLNGSGTV